ncbi:MAG: desulfoferrodoxin [Deltaproteobacteria bacterium]|jgi:superoxide reductase|nr:desulfoferrodoxin [Deltaproteobacteria bacterium]
MSEISEIYKCAKCPLTVEVETGSGCAPTCCGEPMILLAANTSDGAKEKHVPVITKVDGGYKVAIGSVNHPMEEKHYIQWIELTVDGVTQKKRLKPGDAPEAVFKTSGAGSPVAREYCNLHGLWKA